MKYTNEELCKISGIEHKALRDYTDNYLKMILDRNEVIDIRILCAICSEVLRRMLNEKESIS